MIVKCNLHTHTTYCDGMFTPEEMVINAIEKGFEVLGFSSHSPIPTNEEYFLRDVEGYNNEIDRLKEKYKDIITILKGIEADYYCSVNLTGYDFIIGSVHYVKNEDKYYLFDGSLEEFQSTLQEVYNGDIYAMIQGYYDLVVAMIEKIKPTIIGHFDLISLFNNNNIFFDENSEQYKNIVINALDKLKGKDLLFEMNLSAIYRGLKHEAYPCNFILKLINEYGFSVILSNDAHNTEALGYGFDTAIEVLKSIGFKKVRIFKKNNFLDIAI